MADPVRMMWTLIPRRAGAKSVTLTAFIAPQAPRGADVSILQNWPKTVRETFGCEASPDCNCSKETPKGSLELIFATEAGAVFPPLKASVQMCALNEEMWKVFFGGADASRTREVKDASKYLVVSNHGAKAAKHLSKRYAMAFDRHARDPRVPQVASLALDQGDSAILPPRSEPLNQFLDPWAQEPPARARDKEPPAHQQPTPTATAPAATGSVGGAIVGALHVVPDGHASLSSKAPVAPPAPVVPPVPVETDEQKKTREMKQRFLQRIGITDENPNAAPLAEAYVRQQMQQSAQAALLPAPMMSASAEIDPQLDEAAALLGAMSFHRRVVSERLPAPQTSAGPETPEFDVNERFAFLNSHPALLRPLGLVLTIEARVDPQTILAATRVRLNVNKSANDVTQHCNPWTGIRFSKTSTGWRFDVVCDEKTSPLTTGAMLDMNKGDYCLEARDVDGTAVKYIAAQNSHRNAPDETPTTLPAVRSAGISFVHCDRGKSFEAMLQRTAELSCATADQTILHMDDLVRGLIVEVECDMRPGLWFPLGKRKETFKYGPPGTPSDKLLSYNAGERNGIVRITADRVVDRVTELRPELEELHVAEALFRWDGWSLTVPPILGEPLNNLKVVPSRVPWTLETTFAARELPRLRFGHAYRFRLRAADLAGDPFSDATTVAPSKPSASEPAFSYVRYDPVAPPIVLLAAPLRETKGAGESLRHLVILEPMHGLADEATERCLLPPMTTFGTAEQHGMYANARLGISAA
jgi:hypothetical protein